MAYAIRHAAVAVVGTATVLVSGTTVAILAAPAAQAAPQPAAATQQIDNTQPDAPAATLVQAARADLPTATENPLLVDAKGNVLADTAKFAGCLGGFGFVAAPIVAGFMFGGPGGAVSAARAWIPRLGPVGGGILKWCMASVLGIRV